MRGIGQIDLVARFIDTLSHLPHNILKILVIKVGVEELSTAALLCGKTASISTVSTKDIIRRILAAKATSSSSRSPDCSAESLVRRNPAQTLSLLLFTIGVLRVLQTHLRTVSLHVTSTCTILVSVHSASSTSTASTTSSKTSSTATALRPRSHGHARALTIILRICSTTSTCKAIVHFKVSSTTARSSACSSVKSACCSVLVASWWSVSVRAPLI